MQGARPSAAIKGFAAIAGLLAAAAAGLVGLVLALFFAATVVVVGLVGGLLLALAGLAVRARRAFRAKPQNADSDVIEAHRVGGHSWVAYGWDNRR